MIGGFGSGKTKALFHLTKEQYDIDKIYLHKKDLSELKYEFLIKYIVTIQMHLLSVQILRMTFMRILTITTQTEKGRF